MSHSKKTTPNRPSGPDQIAYALCAVAVAALAILNVLASCDPTSTKTVRAAQNEAFGPAAQEPA